MIKMDIQISMNKQTITIEPNKIIIKNEIKNTKYNLPISSMK
jgi:hypothetical protein